MLERIRKIKHLEEFFGMIGFCYFILLAIIIVFLVRFLSTLTTISVRVSKTNNTQLSVFMIDRAKLVVSPVPISPSSTTSSSSLTASSSVPEVISQNLLILNTPTGYLNVRSGPSSASVLITKVLPGETYVYTKKENGWYFISVSSSTEGWILGGYAKEQ